MPDENNHLSMKLGKLEAELGNNKTQALSLSQSLKGQSESIHRIELMLARLDESISRIYEDRKDIEGFKKYVRDRFDKLDNEIDELRIDMNKRQGVAGFFMYLSKIWPLLAIIFSATVSAIYLNIGGGG